MTTSQINRSTIAVFFFLRRSDERQVLLKKFRCNQFSEDFFGGCIISFLTNAKKKRRKNKGNAKEGNKDGKRITEESFWGERKMVNKKQFF